MIHEHGYCIGRVAGGIKGGKQMRKPLDVE